jgi:hypothetical protein
MELECCGTMYFDVCYCRRFGAGADILSSPNCSIKAMVFDSVRVDEVGATRPKGKGECVATVSSELPSFPRQLSTVIFLRASSENSEHFRTRLILGKILVRSKDP